jgi:hypothetical protein
MDHGKGAGTTEPAPVGPAGDAGPIKQGGTKTPLRPYGIVTLMFVNTYAIVRDPGQHETLHGSRQPWEAATQLGYAHPTAVTAPSALPSPSDRGRWEPHPDRAPLPSTPSRTTAARPAACLPGATMPPALDLHRARTDPTRRL